MTTEEKAKAYDDSLQRAKELHEAGNILTKTQMEIVFPELENSENEKIRKALIEVLHRLPSSAFECGAEGGYLGATKEQMLAYLEKQKEQKLDSIRIKCKEHDERREEIRVTEIIESIVRVYGKTQGEVIAGYDIDTLIHWVKEAFDCLNKQNIQKDQKPVQSEDERIRKELIEFIQWSEDRGMTRHDFHQAKRPSEWISWLEHQNYLYERVYEETKDRFYREGMEEGIAYEKHKEQKPNIELIQKSWYMEGYHDCEFGYEPKWIIKTGEGGPRYEENPKYGQHIAKQDYSGLNDFERAIHRGFLCAGVVNVPVNIIKETAQDCLAHLPADWSEDFDKEVENIHKRYPEVSFAKLTRIAYHFSKWASRCKDIEWSEEDETYLQDALWCIEKAEKVAKDEGDMGACWSARRWLKSLRPVKQEWSEKDEEHLKSIISTIEMCMKDCEDAKAVLGYYESDISWLKSLRPSWKPSEDEERLINTSISFLKDFADKGYENAVECIDWLKSKLNGNTCK